MSSVQFARGALGALWREKTWSRAHILAHQQRLLRALVSHARTNSPFWARQLAAVAVDGPVDLAAVPPVSKAVLMEHFEEGLTLRGLTLTGAQRLAVQDQGAGLAQRGLVGALTSGTTGEVGCFVHDRRGWDLMRGVLFARTLRHRLGPRDLLRFGPWRRYRMGFIVAMAGPYVTWLLARDEPLPARAMMLTRMFDVERSSAELREAIQAFSPHFLHGYATSLEVLAQEQLQGRLQLSPEFVSTGSEPLTPGARAVLRQAFPSAQIAETYGATECPVMAVECRHGGLHLNEDVCIVETVDARGAPVPDGTPGAQVLVTNLLNRAQPLIRYQLGDRVTLHAHGGCACGSPLRRIQVEGRVDDTLVLEDAHGRPQAHPPIPLEVVFLGVPGLRQFQLIHARQNQLDVHATILPGAHAAQVEQHLKARFGAYLLRHHLQDVVRVDINIQSDLPRDPRSHKLRQVQNLVLRTSNPPSGVVSAGAGPEVM